MTRDEYVERMLPAYLATAEWADTGETDMGQAPGELEFSENAETDAAVNCGDFFDEAWQLIAKLEISPESCGHDFWLTRNRHGAGFWDHGYGADGDTLSDMCKSFGSVDIYENDNGEYDFE